MRLIDADTVKQDIYKYIKEEGRLINPYRMLDYIDSVETSKKAIPIEWLRELQVRYLKAECYMSVCVVNEILNLWQKENQSLE